MNRLPRHGLSGWMENSSVTMTDYTCGQCGEEFSTNCDVSDIECPCCGSRRCEHCKKWSST